MFVETSPSPVVRRLAQILLGIRGVVAQAAHALPVFRPVLMLLHTRLNRLAYRFARLVARLEAGQGGEPRPRGPRQRRPAVPRPPPYEPYVGVLPRGRLWLVRIALPAAQFSGQLAAFLNDPELRAILQAAPQFARQFRPFCRMLGLDPLPQSVRPPPAASMPAPRAPRQPRPQRPRQPSLAALRRASFPRGIRPPARPRPKTA